MKQLFVFTFLFFSLSIKAQLLKNTEWTQVKVERKDGSTIVDNKKTENTILK